MGLILFYLLALLPFYAITACPDGAISGMTPDVCYYIVNSSNGRTWLGAEYDCVRMGGHLASITNGFMNAFLRGAADARGLKQYWLGGTNMITPGQWQWSDLSNYTYVNWAPGEPSQNNGTNCIVQFISNGNWYSRQCTDSLGYICEIIISGPPACQDSCPPGWIYSSVTSKCFYIATDQELDDYDQALAYCQANDTTLASVHSYAENSIIAGISDYVQKGYFLYLGLKCYNDTSNCTWADGSPYDYQAAWMDGNDYDGTFCVGITGTGGMSPGVYDTWETSPCDEKWDRPFACQLQLQQTSQTARPKNYNLKHDF